MTLSALVSFIYLNAIDKKNHRVHVIQLQTFCAEFTRLSTAPMLPCFPLVGTCLMELFS